MEWYSWLSKTNLEASLIYEYGLAFTKNELQQDDITYFNHEFLQSMGISVAKHRLEILKLATKYQNGGGRGGKQYGRLSRRLRSTINKTKKLLSNNVKKMSSFNKYSSTTASSMPISELTPHWSGALRRINPPNDHKPMVVTRRCTTIMSSGPLEYRRRAHHQENKSTMRTNRSLSASGPLDDHDEEITRYPIGCKSPVNVYAGSLGLSPKVHNNGKEKGGGYDEIQSLWSLMFQDMKPN